MVGFFLVPLFVLTIFAGANGNGNGNNSRQHDGGSPAEPANVSWNDFYHNMLLAGEVQEIIVHPGVNAATIILRPDAMYKVNKPKQFLSIIYKTLPGHVDSQNIKLKIGYCS
jgi:hypothetical protein